MGTPDDHCVTELRFLMCIRIMDVELQKVNEHLVTLLRNIQFQI